MTVYVLIREDQNHYGYIDTSIAGVFEAHETAQRYELEERARALAEGLRLEDNECRDVDWDVSWKIEMHEVEVTTG